MPQAIETLAGPSEEDLARTPGRLQGIVHDAALSPVANATVEDARTSAKSVTDAAGYFELVGLETGEHLLYVTASGFVTRSLTIQARNGTTFEVDIALEPAASVEPYVETRELTGFFACALVVNGEAQDCASADPNHRDTFEFELAPSGKNMVLELQYDPADSPGGSHFLLHAETVGYGAQDIDLGSAGGEGYARIEVPTAVLAKYYPEGGLMRARVSLAPGGAPAAATAQLSFIVYVTTFYHQAGAAGFSVIRSA